MINPINQHGEIKAKMSDLEKFIHEHRDELDQVEAVPTEALWQKIKAGQTPKAPAKAKGLNWRLLSILGLALVLIGWGIALFRQKEVPATSPSPVAKPAIAPTPLHKEAEKPLPTEQASPLQAKPDQTPPAIAAQKLKSHKNPTTKPKAPAALQPVHSPEEEALQQLVALKQKEIGLDTLDKEKYANLLKELDELEITVEQARKDFAGMPENERLLQTLIRYYELKIRILEQISNEINKRQYHEALEKRI